MEDNENEKGNTIYALRFHQKGHNRKEKRRGAEQLEKMYGERELSSNEQFIQNLYLNGIKERKDCCRKSSNANN